MATNWDDCLEDCDSWLHAPLQQSLHYESPLPVQKEVVPMVRRALLSGLPMDVCLTAPTGSGKTLCYLLPMLHLVADCKRGVDHTRLRALVLVPTKALGVQVLRELHRLTQGTSISTVSLCSDVSVKEEAEALVRTASIMQSSTPGKVTDTSLNGNDSCSCDRSDGNFAPLSPLMQLCYYSRADIVISTPQRLLRHLDGTPGLSLADLRFLVIDEADQVLAGNFVNFVSKVVERFEEEQTTRLGDDAATRRLTKLTYGLHKMLCSATLSSQMARISEVRLRNCRHFSLDSYGNDIRREDEGEPLLLQPPLSKAKAIRKMCGSNDSAGNDATAEVALPVSREQLVRTSFALPPRLQEHVIFVEDWYRHAALLKLIRAIIIKQESSKKSPLRGGESEVQGGEGWQEQKRQPEHQDGFSQTYVSRADDYPSCEDDAGKRILVFCRSADEARVMGHFLLSAGVQATEFTTLATESERRRTLLKSSSDSCVVASDALMRGIDVPNVGHVIMYSPPETLSQYVHRAGRTARAMRAGHLHLLLQKNGPSGTQSDGEVAVFKALSSAISRTLPVRYERHFFMIDVLPGDAVSSTNINCSEGRHESIEEKADVATDKTRALIDEADAFLKETQARLMISWTSALHSAKRGAVVGNTIHADAKDGCGTMMHNPANKRERKE